MASRPSATGEAGFTLTELLVVLAIIGLMVAAAPALLKSALPGMRSLAAARALAQDLRVARGTAIARAAPVTVTFDAPRQSYQTSLDEKPHALAFALAPGQPRLRLVFYPDGSSSGGALAVGGHHLTVGWLSGQVSLDE